MPPAFRSSAGAFGGSASDTTISDGVAVAPLPRCHTRRPLRATRAVTAETAAPVPRRLRQSNPRSHLRRCVVVRRAARRLYRVSRPAHRCSAAFRNSTMAAPWSTFPVAPRLAAAAVAVAQRRKPPLSRRTDPADPELPGARTGRVGSNAAGQSGTITRTSRRTPSVA